MLRTTTAESPGRPPAPSLRIEARRPAARRTAARIAAAAITVVLLIGGCAAPRGPDAPPAPAAERTAADPTQPPDRTAQQPLKPPARTAARSIPKSGITVRPAAPPAQVAKNPAPRFLSVAGTTITDMAVVEVGVSPTGAMEIPEPFNQAGWYRFGPAPGAAAGTAVLAAHVDTTSDSAPFSQLKSLPAGTLVTVQRQGAPPLTFRVTRVELMAKDAFDGDSVFRRDGPPQLKLVTCGGRWLDEQQDYGDNVIVTAVPA